jgi:Protein of unknown function (DUF3040)
MALSMDEQRMLAEIERRLAAEDPGLASRLSSFRRPRPASVLRSPRARIIGSLFTVALVTAISLLVYAMVPFRGHLSRQGSRPQATAAHPVLTVPGNTTASSPAIRASSPAKAGATTKTNAKAGTAARPGGTGSRAAKPSGGTSAIGKPSGATVRSTSSAAAHAP